MKALETGEIKYPEVSMPICLKRENSWREEYEPYEDGFYPDDDDAFYDALENGFDMPWNKQEPVVVGTKVGRNEPCLVVAVRNTKNAVWEKMMYRKHGIRNLKRKYDIFLKQLLSQIASLSIIPPGVLNHRRGAPSIKTW